MAQLTFNPTHPATTLHSAQTELMDAAECFVRQTSCGKKKRLSLRSFLSYCTFYSLLLLLESHLHIEDEAAGCAEKKKTARVRACVRVHSEGVGGWL